MRRALLIVLVAAAAPHPATAGDAVYARDARRAYIAQTLTDLRAMTAEARGSLEEALYLGARKTCRAAQGDAPLDCLVQMAGAVCAARPADQQAACRRVADVVVTNQRSETELVDEQTRIHLMNSSANYRVAMRQTLRKRYAELAAELVLERGAAGDDRALAADIDAFCADRRRPLAWQRCVAALVWYAGTDPGDQP